MTASPVILDVSAELTYDFAGACETLVLLEAARTA